MIPLRRAALAYILVLAVSALGLATLALARAGLPTGARAVLAVIFAALMTLAYCFPLQFSHRIKLTLDTSVIVAAVLLFEPGVAMLIVAGGTALAHALRREPWIQAVFNTAQTALQAGAGGGLLALAGVRHDALRFDRPGQLVALAAVGAGMYAVNTVAVAGIVGLQSGLSPWLVWRQSVGFDALEEVAQLALGLLTAAMVDVYIWTLPLLLVLGLVVYHALERQLQLRQQTRDAIEELADIVDLRDPYTADHSRRVARYARELATALRLAPDEVAAIELAARAHDVGKMVIDKDVLAKPGPLSDADVCELKAHPATGERILMRFPQFAASARFVRHHHERMDGSGYPDGLAGEAIPLGARVIAVADAFDAMATARPYRPAMPRDVVLAELERRRGGQWDGDIVDVLLELLADGRLVLPDQTVLAASPREVELRSRPVIA